MFHFTRVCKICTYQHYDVKPKLCNETRFLSYFHNYGLNDLGILITFWTELTGIACHSFSTTDFKSKSALETPILDRVQHGLSAGHVTFLALRRLSTPRVENALFFRNRKTSFLIFLAQRSFFLLIALTKLFLRVHRLFYPKG